MTAHLERTALEGESCWKLSCQQQQCWAGDSHGRLNSGYSGRPPHTSYTYFIIFQELQFPEFVLLFHRHIRKVSLLVRRKTGLLSRTSKLFSYLFYICIFLKSRRRNPTAVVSLLMMSELRDQLSSKTERHNGLKDLTLMLFAQ